VPRLDGRYPRGIDQKVPLPYGATGYTADSLLEKALPRIENSLWGALAPLEEREVLLSELEQSAKESDPGLAARYAAEARRMRRLGRSLRELATDPAFTSTLPQERRSA